MRSVGTLVPFSSEGNWKSSYSFQVTSVLPIQNGSIFTLRCGPSSALRLPSEAGLPIRNSPAGIGSMSNLTSDPTMGSLYAFMSAALTSLDTASTRAWMALIMASLSRVSREPASF